MKKPRHGKEEVATWVSFDQTQARCYKSATDTVAGVMPGGASVFEPGMSHE